MFIINLPLYFRTQKQRSQTSPLPPGSSLESSHGSENVDEEKSQEGPSPMTRSLSANRDPNTKPGTAAVFKGTRKRAESEIGDLQHFKSGFDNYAYIYP